MRDWLHEELDDQYDMLGYEEAESLVAVRFRFINPTECVRFALTFK
jgi:hypothetical protein